MLRRVYAFELTAHVAHRVMGGGGVFWGKENCCPSVFKNPCLSLFQLEEGSRGVPLGTLIALMVEEGEDWKKVEVPAAEVAPPSPAAPAPQVVAPPPAPPAPGPATSGGE